MRIRVLFLGPSKDLAGVENAAIELPVDSTVDDVRGELLNRYPRLRAGMKSIRFAVNQTFATDDTVLHENDEIALIPPVSGGSGAADVLVELVHGPISVERVRKFVMGDPGLGGIAAFEGITRAENDPQHGPLLRLDYEAYESMAVRQLQHLAGEARSRWGAGRVAIVHRLGPVPPGDVSVMIAVACPHRAEAFEACRFLIDTLKKDVPIWKKDVFADGFVRWVEPTDSADCRFPVSD